MKYLYVFGTIFFTVIGQLILKWKVSQMPHFPSEFIAKLNLTLHFLINPWIIGSYVCAFLASVCWIAALTKFELSYAYPFTALAFVLVTFFSVWLFGEVLNWQKILGLLLVLSGLFVLTRGIK